MGLTPDEYRKLADSLISSREVSHDICLDGAEALRQAADDIERLATELDAVRRVVEAAREVNSCPYYGYKKWDDCGSCDHCALSQAIRKYDEVVKL